MQETLDETNQEVDVHAHHQGVWYVDSPEFHEPGAKTRIRRPVGKLYKSGFEHEFFKNDDFTTELGNLHRPILTRAGERHLFRLMNFTRFQMNELCQSVDGNLEKLKSRDRHWMTVAAQESANIGNTIAGANLRLSAYWAKRLSRDGENPHDVYTELLTPLERSIRRFDYTRGNKFSTFASKSMRSHMERVREYKARDDMHFPTGNDLSDALDKSAPEGVNTVIRTKLLELVNRLPNEQACAMLKDYFALGDSPEPMTHQEIADKLGCKKQNSVGVIGRAIKALQSIAAKLHLHEEDFVERISWNELENG